MKYFMIFVYVPLALLFAVAIIWSDIKAGLECRDGGKITVHAVGSTCVKD